MATAELPPIGTKKRRKPASYAGQEMTLDQFLALPDDRVERWLVDGIVLEWGPMSYRNQEHSFTATELTFALRLWIKNHPEFPARVYSGDVGCILNEQQHRAVGIDAALFSTDVLASQTGRWTVIVGAPLVAVEVMSPNDTTKKINNKIDLYLGAGTTQVWIADPYLQTVTIHRRGQLPNVLTRDQDLIGEPELPGFRVNVLSLFLPLVIK